MTLLMWGGYAALGCSFMVVPVFVVPTSREGGEKWGTQHPEREFTFR
jgi:hypothetical protein